MTSRTIAIYGLYLAIFIIMGLVPQVGYITIAPTITITIISIPVILITIHKGWRGALFGVFMWGITAIIALPIQGAYILSQYGWWRAVVIFFGGRMIIFIPIYLFIFIAKNIHKLRIKQTYNVRIKQNDLHPEDTFKESNRNFKKYIQSTMLAIVIVCSNTIIVIALLAYLAPNRGSFIVTFVSLAPGLAIEWTIIPFLVAPAITPLANYFKLKENAVAKDKY